MNKLKYILALLAIVMAANSCQKFEDLEADPNRSTTVPPSLVLRGILKDMYVSPWGDISRYCQYYCVNYNYYGNNEYWSGSADFRYTTLKNVVKMEEEAARINLPEVNAYSALGKFFRAYFYYDMTMKMGDIPLTQALQGSANVTPKYDTQKEVFKQILVWLEESNRDLQARIGAADQTLQGDIYYNGNLRQWQRAVNTFKLRVLAQLSLKENDADLNIKQEFSKILTNPGQYPIFESNSDDLAYQYNTSSDKYPTNPDNLGFDALRNNMSATNIGLLTSLQDPRVFVIAEPAAAKIAAGVPATDFSAYVGAEFDEGLDEMTLQAQNGVVSLIARKRYYSGYTAEPGVQIGYAEMCFTIAEAISRGWATGNAQEWYNKGITASMNFFSIVNSAAIDAYLAQPSVAYKGGVDGRKQILEQKYLALFMQAGLESYYTWRRTGIPEFAQGGPGTGNGGVIPNRFQYPTSERDNNTANYNAALQSQFGNTDDSVNSALWIVR